MMKDSKNLYEVLGLNKDATQAEVKTAYRKLALQFHPDKNPGEEAKEKFQTLQKVYEVLRDPEKRKVYDETGSWDGAQDGGLDAAFSYFCRNPITEDDIMQFEVEFRGSTGERAELLELYTRFKGNMHMVFEYLVCSREDMDSHRFMDSVLEAIEAGDVKKYRTFTAWSKEVQQRPRPVDPLKPSKKRKKKAKGDSMDLVAAIRNKNKGGLDSMLKHLEEKYGGAHIEDVAEPTEEEFEHARKRAFGAAKAVPATAKGRKKKVKKK